MGEMKVKAVAHRYRQYRYVAALSFAGLLLIGGASILLQGEWIPANIFRWGCAALLGLSLLIWRILAAFAKEPGNLPDACFPGVANQLTVARGLLISLLAGFLLLNAPTGFSAWIPGILYTTALIMDGFDGYLARLRNETSAFGAFLDRDLDALGTLIGILLAVRYGRLPDWYILAGMAYYLFVFGQWWRAKQGLPLHPLPASRYRRQVAIVQSLFIAVALLPVPPLPKSGVAAALVIIPVLAGFLRDWLGVAGYDLRSLASAGSADIEKSS
jgi:CDP-diacylglycerol---glycerol-3-phosphate 3-phosphatidyltransferase